jgi:hypothetical protein
VAELDPNQAWPIGRWGEAFDRWKENEAWWIGDTELLEQLYAKDGVGRMTHRVHGEPHEGGLVGWAHARFWGRPIPNGEQRTRLHIPAPADVATLSSDSLFAEPPSIEYPDDLKDVSDKQRERLASIMASEQARAAQAEGGELVSAFGAAAMRLAWDDSRDRVWFEPIGADVTIPEFRAGKLVALNAFTEYRRGSYVYRHIERHEPGRIIHTLYEGRDHNLGRIVPLTEIPETKAYAEIPGLTDQGILTGISRLTAAWWINAPARAWRRKGDLAEAGRSDFSGGVIGLFDALDETWSSWMRDLKLGRGRLLVDSAYLDSNGPSGSGVSFDAEREVYAALDVAATPDKPWVQAEQFEIRTEEHAATATAIYNRILSAIGQGDLDKETASVDKTATEVNAGTSTRERTRDRKALYAGQTLAELSQTAMLLDGAKYPGKGGGDFGPIEVTFPPASQTKLTDLAPAIAQLRAAKTLSLETAVRLQNPTWRKSEVDEEIARLEKEQAAANPVAPDPTRMGRNPADQAAVDAEAKRLGLDSGTPANEQQQAAGGSARG